MLTEGILQAIPSVASLEYNGELYSRKIIESNFDNSWPHNKDRPVYYLLYYETAKSFSWAHQQPVYSLASPTANPFSTPAQQLTTAA